MRKIIHSFCLFVFFFFGIQQLKAQDPNWTINAASYQYSMTFTAFLNVDGVTLTSVNDKVGAFVNGEIRGVSNVVYQANVDKYVVYLSVYANTNNESINFKIYDSVLDTVIDINKTALFNIDENVGGIFQSYSIASPELSNDAIFNSFSFVGIDPVSVQISSNSINIILPENTNLASLKAIFSSSKNSRVYIGSNLQQSGTSVQNFTNPITYSVLSESESVLRQYEVSVSVAVNNSPTTVSIFTSQNLVTNAVPINLNVSFSKTIFGFTLSDFILENAVVANFSIIDSQNFTVQIIPLSQGEFSAQIPSNISFDSNGNQNEASNKLVFTYDISKPIINNISVNDTASKWFLITFNEAVFNVDALDFELKGGAVDGLIISGLEKISQTQYKITISNTIVDQGIVALQLKNSNDIVDLANNALVFSEFESYFKTLKKITITADAKTKVYGETDPILTYTITSGTIAADDVLSGGLTRVAGEDVGEYIINSTLANDKYEITYIPAKFTITEDFSNLYTWNGNIDRNWNNEANWDKGLIPKITHTVVIPNTAQNQPIITAVTGATAKKLTVNNGASLVIESGGSLIVEESSTGNIKYNVAIVDTNWHLVSSPVEGQFYNDNWVFDNAIAISAKNNRGISTYNNTVPDAITAHWNYFNGETTETFDSGRGYAILRTQPGNYDFTGSIVTTDVMYSISQNDNNWNLIGNPYSSYIDISQFITTNTNKISNSFLGIYIWDGIAYAAKTSGYIHPGQGFFINSSIPSGIVSFTKAMQSHQQDVPYYKNSNTSITLIISDGSLSSRTQINYLEGKSKGLDPGFDLGAFDGVSSDLSVFTHLLEDNEQISFGIQALPNSDLETLVIPVGIKAKNKKEITFSLDVLNLPRDKKVFLEDKKTNTVTRLDQVNSNYGVTLTEALNGVGRFFLRTSGNVLNLYDINSNKMNVYKFNSSTIKIEGLPQGNNTIKIFNILGKELMNLTFKDKSTKEISLSNFTAGVYLIKIQTEVNVLSKKIVIE